MLSNFRSVSSQNFSFKKSCFPRSCAGLFSFHVGGRKSLFSVFCQRYLTCGPVARLREATDMYYPIRERALSVLRGPCLQLVPGLLADEREEQPHRTTV